MNEVLRLKNLAKNCIKLDLVNATKLYEKALIKNDISHYKKLELSKYEEIWKISNVLHNNLAYCYLNQKNGKKALENCEQVLNSEFLNEKAHYRKILSHKIMGNFDKAYFSAVESRNLFINGKIPVPVEIVNEMEELKVFEF